MITIEDIRDIVLENSGISLERLISGDRDGEIPTVKKVITYLCLTYTKESKDDIAALLGYKIKHNSSNNSIDVNYAVFCDWLSLNNFIPDYYHKSVNSIMLKPLRNSNLYNLECYVKSEKRIDRKKLLSLIEKLK
jgi:hypothetical protein